MLVSLITRRKYHTIQLPEWKDGHFILTEPDTGEELFDIIGNGSGWFLSPCGDNQVTDDVGDALSDGQLIHVRIGEMLEKALIYAENSGDRYAKYGRCAVADNVSLVIGTDQDADIPLRSRVISARHCLLTCQNRKWRVKSLDEAMGVYVNGVRTVHADLSPGDMVSIMNQKFIVLPGVLAMNAQNVSLKSPMKNVMPLQFPSASPDKIYQKKSSSGFFYREPRFTNGLFEKDVNILPPPSPIAHHTRTPADAEENSDGLLTYGPMVASGLLMVLGGIANPLYGLGMMASSLLWPSLRKKKRQEAQLLKKQEYEKLMEEEEKEEEKRRQLYAQYLTQLDRELDAINKKQTEQLLKYNPRPDQEASKLIQDKTSLWNRRPEHSDFLDVRLGTGNLPVKANIQFPDESLLNPNDPLLESIQALRNKERMLRGVPIMLQLSRFYCVGVSGEPVLTESMIAKIILQLTMHIGYDDLKICILGKLPAALQMLRWLPHTWNDERTVHMVAENKEELTRLLPELDDALRNHHARHSGADVNSSNRTMLFLIMDESLSGSGMVTRLLFEQPRDRVHVLAAAEHSRNLPRRTDLAIGLLPHIGRMLWQEDNVRQTADFKFDASVMDTLGHMVNLMANTRLDLQQEMTQMPDVVPFLDMFGVQDVARLNIMNRWLRSDPIHSLSAPIGVTEDGNLCMLDLHEKGDGPHGLIAGTTGSGKSEMLMNYILSMAVNYSPQEVSFILIDYKGGGMAKAFESLPHTAGIITNLDGREINRSLQSIESELIRRQQIFSDCQTKLGMRNIDIYKYQQLFREKKVSEPLSHLVIITDEFAELKTQQPDFLQQLIRAARIGRSLGVHLILATQKPSGVVDPQIWSNSNFHICLRVQTPDDSREVLKCEDAAHLTRVGSMFKQVGYGEVLVKAQSGWTGADYAPDSVNLPNCGVDVLNHMGSVLRHEDVSISSKSSLSQLEAGINYITELGKNSRIHARPLWLPVLEKDIPLSSLREKYHLQDEPGVIRPILGEADDPFGQRRHLVRPNLSAGKNTVIYGCDGSGKVMALKAILEDLLTHHTAEEVQLYMLDCADDGLAIYREAPQVGDVVGSDEEEKMQRLLTMLEDQIRIRKKRIGGIAMGETLCDRLKRAGMCNIVVIIHHIIAFRSLSESLQYRFSKIMSEGPHYGVTFLATQEAAGGLDFLYARTFTQKYVLQMHSESDYSLILDKTKGLSPMAVKGRGIYHDESMYEFQTASAEQHPGELCAALNRKWTGKRAEPIRILPEQLSADALYEYLRPATPWRLPVALNIQTIQPEYYDFGSRRLHLALGDPGHLAQLFNGLASLALKNGLQVMVLDPNEYMDPIPGGENIGAAALEEKIWSMVHHNQEIKSRQNRGEKVAPGAETMVLIPDIRAAVNALTPEGCNGLETIMALARDIWGLRFIVGGSSEAIMARMTVERKDSGSDWVNQNVSRSNGLCVENSFADYSFLNHDIVKKQETAFPKGYIIRDRAVTRVQFVQESQKEAQFYGTSDC